VTGEKALRAAKEAGWVEPVTLHPALDPNRCISIGACADACPEGDILAIVNGSPELVNPTRCIGHGACAAACPVDAITLVFGTETRGVDIPFVRETFETNVEGVYIAGELGGMGLIRNAVTQGREAVEYLAGSLGRSNSDAYDVAIIGAGPAGIAATLEAKKHGLRYITLEQDDIGGTVLTYPRHKVVMTQPMELPLYGKSRFREIQKEDLLAFWQTVIEETGINIHTREKLERVTPHEGEFDLTTTKGTYRARRLVLAIGRRGTPRKLGVPGEQSSKVTYRLLEPEQYQGSRALVVGGGDSAIEAALALSAQTETEVQISYRKDLFSRVKPRNLDLLQSAIERGAVTTWLNTTVEKILPDKVTLVRDDSPLDLANDFVLVFAGGELPTQFLRKLGIRIDTKFGEA